MKDAYQMLKGITQQQQEEIINHMRSAQRILFITGAGMSADSGLPTYRGIGGLYNNENTDDDMPIEVAISGDMLRSRPEITWKYLLQIANSCHAAKHNDGHKVIAEIEAAKKNTWILTQNIDGFHKEAGSKNTIEIHGTLDRVNCMSCSFDGMTKDIEIDESNLPPHCPKCGAILRHEVVLFGEQLPDNEINKLYGVLETGYDMVFTIGTTSVFPYIAQPVMLAKQKGIPTVEINPGKTEVSHLVDYKIEDGAAKTLRTLWDRAS